jgi:L-rhamnose-H+ transport protein
MINFGLAFGSEIVENARRLTDAGPNSVNAIWPVLLVAGFLPNTAYCAWLIQRHSSWSALTRTRPAINWLLGSLMGLLWFGSNIAYGYGSQAVGSLGLVEGWPVFMGCIVLTANVWGASTGEWRQAPRRAIQVLLAGVALLIGGVSLIGYASGVAG